MPARRVSFDWGNLRFDMKSQAYLLAQLYSIAFRTQHIWSFVAQSPA